MARLALFHRHANHVCFRVLEEVLDAFDREGLSVLVLKNIRQDLFAPSDWWLRLYYELGDSSWLWWHRSVRHPVRVGRWLTRRAVSYAGWRTIGVRGRRSHTPGDENRAGERSAR